MEEKPKKVTRRGSCRKCKTESLYLTNRKHRQKMMCHECGEVTWHDFRGGATDG